MASKSHKYEIKSDHDLLVSLHTWKDEHSKNVEKTFLELKKQDEKLDGKIAKVDEKSEERTTGAHQRIDRVRWISAAAGFIGGIVGYVTSAFTKN